jgi:hypothetical protein
VFKVLYLSLFFASLDSTYQKAADTARVALLETPQMKNEIVQLRSEAEEKLNIYLGLTKEDLVYAAYAYPLFANKISSKPFKKFKYETENRIVIRPELEYHFKSKEYTNFIFINMEF